MISIKQEFSLHDFEDFLAEMDGNNHHDLQIPNKIKSNAMGAVAALIQLIITWSRRDPNDASLRLYADCENDVAAKKFATTPFGLVALVMAQRITSRGGASLKRRDILKEAIEYVRCMHSGDLAELREYNKSILPIVCVDHASDLRRPVRLYRQDVDELRNRQAFRALTKNFFDELSQVNLDDIDSQIDDISSFVFEAFQNTHEHAQTDLDGNIYLRSSRGIIFSFQSASLNDLYSSDVEAKALNQYFQGIKLQKEWHRDAHFAEVSVFDSGPGIAQSWISHKDDYARGVLKIGDRLKDIPLDEEYRSVIDCLNKGKTTKNSVSRGNGLYRIMQVAKRNGGMIRLRTGRLSLMKGFSEKSREPLNASDLEMHDVYSGEVPIKAHSWADGCVITIILPLNRR